MMDSNERLLYLDTRHLNETAKRIIDSTIKSIIEINKANSNPVLEIKQERIEAIRNALFLKFCGIDYEAIFQSNYTDDKYSGVNL